MTNIVKCPECTPSGGETLRQTRLIKRSEDMDDEATEEYICLDCEQSLVVTYSLELTSVEVEED
jgi:hypothetical protein